MKKRDRFIELLAKDSGYINGDDLLCDYGLIPTVRVPHHKKREIVPLIARYIKKKNKHS